jgi:hypothetical protein
MAPTPSQQRQIDAILRQLEPRIRAAFIKAIYRARAAIDVAELLDALRAGDIERAVRLFRLDDAAMFPLEDAIRATFIAGGQSVVAPTGLRGAWGFNGRHMRAEQWTRNIGSTLIQRIRDDTLEMARQVITAGLRDGFTPQAVQRELTGTLNRLTGQREGGFLGLTTQQAQSIVGRPAGIIGGVYSPAKMGALQKLASGEPALMREYLGLKLRDRRYDATVKRAIRDGAPVAPADLEKIIRAHKSKALAYRGQVIAKNEAFTAQAAGRDEAYRQMLERPDVVDVTARWQHNRSQVPRPDHVAMNGTVISLAKGEAFVFPDATMKHPHDPAGGAKHSIGCFAPWTKVARLGLRNAIKYKYVGDLVELSFSGDVSLSVTPNHPVLTPRGWVSAGEIAEGEDVFQCRIGDASITDHDVKNVLASAKELYDAAERAGRLRRVPREVVNFHGHIPDHDVNVVPMKRALGFAIDPARQKEIDDGLFALADISTGLLLAQRMGVACGGQLSPGGSGGVSGADAKPAGLWRRFCSAAAIAFGVVGALYAKLLEASVDGRSAGPERISDWKNCKAIIVEALNVAINGLPKSKRLQAGSLGFAGASAAVWGCDAQVVQAGADNGNGEAKLSGYLGHALRRCGKSGNVGIMGGALVAPSVAETTVVGVRRFHYDGLVYNFESTSNVLVAEGIVNHNCGCIAVYRVKLERD